MPRKKRYPDEIRIKADELTRKLLSEGVKNNDIAKTLEKELQIDRLSGRWISYRIASEMGLGLRKTQHIDETTHGKLRELCKHKLMNDGWNVIEEQNEIRKIVEEQGLRGNPDLYAYKNKESMFVEVYCDDKRFLNQLERWEKLNLKLVLPVNTSNLELWGTNILKGN